VKGATLAFAVEWRIGD